MDDLSAIPIAVRIDTTAGLIVLSSQLNCIPIFMIDPEDYRVEGSAGYIRANRVAEALGCEFELKRSTATLVCRTNPELLQPVGSDSGQFAPGFRSQPESSMVLAFFRSLEWDPFSRQLALRLESVSDSLRAAGLKLVGIHGYGHEESLQWQDSLNLSFPLVADSTSAAMRGYDVFDRGNLPHAAWFLIDAQGIIRSRYVFTDLAAPPNLEPLMLSIAKTRK